MIDIARSNIKCNMFWGAIKMTLYKTKCNINFIICLLCVFLKSKSAKLIPKTSLEMSCFHYMYICIRYVCNYILVEWVCTNQNKLHQMFSIRFKSLLLWKWKNMRNHNMLWHTLTNRRNSHFIPVIWLTIWGLGTWALFRDLF